VSDWISTYLRAVGAPNTKRNRDFLASWQRWEGGHTNNNARWNYLNTTQNAPGARSINSVGVKAYRSLNEGARAFAATLANGRYAGLLQGLRQGDPRSRASVAGLSTWLSGSPDSHSGLAYAQKVLGTKVSGGAAPGPPGAALPTSGPRPLVAPRLDQSKLAIGNLRSIAMGADPISSFQAMAAKMARARLQAPQAPTGAPLAGAGTLGGATGRLGKVIMQAGADRPGVHTQADILNFARQVAGIYGQPLRVGTGTRHSQMTVNGNQSQHWTGEAVDIPATGAALIRMGQDALIAAGMPARQARKQRGGLFNVGGRQIIFNTHIGGDHTNHLHLGA